MTGRRTSAAMPKMGFTCYVCPGAPSVITGGLPGDAEAFENARREADGHLNEHAEEIATTEAPLVPVRVYPRTTAGPTRLAQAAA
ncbi:hypothetical protein [Micromonospora sp. NPDC005652]|uniref:hypothetical protein n=1 Tax=Micromonospora sp. NPDC005652 TaxID=3157046 RepID=UPI003410ACD4